MILPISCWFCVWGFNIVAWIENSQWYLRYSLFKKNFFLFKEKHVWEISTIPYCLELRWKPWILFWMYLFFLLVFPLPSVVHDNVSPWPLQQFFLCCSSPWHCNGIQDITNYPVISYPQWQTGINCHLFPVFYLRSTQERSLHYLSQVLCRLTTEMFFHHEL